MTTNRPQRVRPGATLSPNYLNREIAVFGVTKEELKRIASLNDVSALQFSIAATFFGYAVAIWTNAAFYDGQLSPMGQLATMYLAPLLCVVAVAFLVLGILSVVSRNGLIKEIEASPPA